MCLHVNLAVAFDKRHSVLEEEDVGMEDEENGGVGD